MTRPMVIFLNCRDRREWPNIDSLEQMERGEETDRRAGEWLKRVKGRSDLTDESVHSLVAFYHDAIYEAGEQALHLDLKEPD